MANPKMQKGVLWLSSPMPHVIEFVDISRSPFVNSRRLQEQGPTSWNFKAWMRLHFQLQSITARN